MKRAGDTDTLKKLTKELEVPRPSIRPSQAKLAATAAEIRLNPDATEAAFMARQLVQCTLPHSNPGDVPAWQRTNGNVTLIVQSGWDSKKQAPIGYPYGTLPRLLLFWITTESVRSKSRRLELGNSLSQFMRELGLVPASDGGGKRSDATRLREQMRRLFGCRITFETTLRSGNQTGEKWLNMDVAPEGELWWDPKKPDQAGLWGSWIELGEKFYQAITNAPVPVDMRALRELKRSPLALDLYSWLSYRAFTVTKKREPQFITWALLMRQLGSEYDRMRDFKGKAKATIRRVQTVFPGLVVIFELGGLTIYPSAPAVQPRQ